jgi:hypothetical protein
MAAIQADPQRLLFVFTRPELPENSSEAEKKSFNAGQGGNLTPVICVDKILDDLSDFSGLVEESKNTGQDWHIVFVTALAGHLGVMPSSAEAEPVLTKMVTSIQQGLIENFLAFDRQGNVVQFT